MCPCPEVLLDTGRRHQHLLVWMLGTEARGWFLRVGVGVSGSLAPQSEGHPSSSRGGGRRDRRKDGGRETPGQQKVLVCGFQFCLEMCLSRDGSRAFWVSFWGAGSVDPGGALLKELPAVRPGPGLQHRALGEPMSAVHLDPGSPSLLS